MKARAEVVIALLDLLECEGKTLRRNLGRLGLGLVLFAAAGGLAVAGTGVVIWSLYVYLSGVLGPPAGGFLCGLLTLCVAGGLLWAAARLIR